VSCPNRQAADQVASRVVTYGNAVVNSITPQDAIEPTAVVQPPPSMITPSPPSSTTGVPHPSTAAPSGFDVEAVITVFGFGSSFPDFIASNANRDALREALISDLATTCGVDRAAVQVSTLTPTTQTPLTLIVNFTVNTGSAFDASSVAAVIRAMPTANATLPATTAKYRAAYPAATADLRVSTAWAQSSSDDAPPAGAVVASTARAQQSALVLGATLLFAGIAAALWA
jgi:hypothetical protein